MARSAARNGRCAWPLSRIVRLHGERPDLEVTPPAMEVLRQQMALICEYTPVVVLAWVIGASWGRILPNGEEDIHVRGPHWGIGFHDRAKLPANEVVELAGIPFTFGGTAEKIEWLSGATLDFIDGD